jgi:TP901 family phage tail tape measure protein
VADDILVRIDVDSSQALAATAAYSRSLEKLEATQAKATAAQARLDTALAESGAGSDKAIAAQAKLDASLRRTAAAQDQVAIAARRSAEVQSAAASKAAAAQEAAAAKQAAAMRKLGTIAGGVGVAIAAGLGLAAKAAADFDAKLATFRSLSGASASQMEKLSASAHGFADLGISASEAGDAMIELTKAGLSVQQILGGSLKAALILAADGQMNVADATEIMASAMVQFKLPAQDAAHVADLLAAGADKALGSVQDLGEGLQYAGLGAHQAGLSIDETVGALAEFAAAGLKGSQGGTTLQQVLRQLLGPTDKAAAEIKALGLNLYDSNGQFVGLASVAGQLQDKLGGMSEAQKNAALNTLFTSRAVRGATILYQDGKDGVDSWTKKVNDSGFAADQARGKMNSLSGDLQKLGATLQNDLIDVGQQLQPILRDITRDLTTFGDIIGGLPDPVKSAAVELGVVTAALGLGFWAFTRIKGAAATLAETLGILSKAQIEVGATAETMAAEETVAAGAMTRAGGASLAAGRLNKGALIGFGAGTAAIVGGQVVNQYAGGSRAGSIGGDALTGAGIGAITGSVVPVVGTAVGAIIGGALGAIQGARSSDHNPAFEQIVAAMKARQDRQAQQKVQFGNIGSAASASKELAQLGMTSEQTYSDLAKVGQGATKAAPSLESLAKAADAAWKATLRMNNVVLTRRGDWSSYQQAIDDATQALKDNGKTLDQHTAKGRANAAALDTIASSAATYAQTISDPILKLKFMEDSRRQLIQTAMKFGDTRAEAKKYTDSVLGIPTKAITAAAFEKNQAASDVATYEKAIDGVPGFVKTVITAETQDALRKMAYVQQVANGLHGTMWINVQYTGATLHSGAQLQPASGGLISHRRLQKFSGGGQARFYRGPGGPTGDMIPAMVSDFEFVNKASIVRQQTPAKFFALNAGRADIVPRQTAYLANGGMAGVPQWRGGNMTQTIKLDVSQIRRALDGMTVLVGNAGEVATGVKETVRSGILGAQTDSRNSGRSM